MLIVAAPMLFTNSGFALDFTNHLWLTWVQGKAFTQLGHPTYFFNSNEAGLFYPYFAFYGGTLYAVTGVLGELLGGHPIASYLAVTTLGIAGAYGGTLWLGRQLGLGRWLSHAPALVVITSAYYVSDLYGRGAWTELMATSAIAPMLASAVHLTRSTRWRPGPVLVFIASTVVFTGSHNITLLWGTTVVGAALVILWLALGRPTKLPLRRLAMVAGLGLACLSISAWFLVPDISYAKDVRAHLETALGEEGYASYRAYIKPILAFDPPSVLFNPLRHVPKESTVPALFVQIPDWFLIWALLAGVMLLWRPGMASAPLRSPSRHARARRPARRAAEGAAAGKQPAHSARAPTIRRATLQRAWLSFAGLLAVLLLMIMVSSFWNAVPFPFTAIQFPFRLGSYVSYAIAALVLIGALAMQMATGNERLAGPMRRLRMGLLVVCAVSLGLCLWQEWVPNTLYPTSYKQRTGAIGSVNKLPHSWYDQGSFNDDQAPVVQARSTLLFSPSKVHGDRLSTTVDPPPGTAPIQTNITGGAYLVHVSGLEQVGRNEFGYAVLRRPRNNSSGPVHVVIETNRSARIVFGWVLSLLGCLTALAVLAWTTWTSLRQRYTSGSQTSG